MSSENTLVMGERMEYEGYHGCASACRLRVFDPNRGAEMTEAGVGKRPLVVILTELDDNPGTSETNRVEHLATLTYQRLGSPDTPPIFIEHYPNRGAYNKVTGRWQSPEQYDFVAMVLEEGRRFHRPSWRCASRVAVEVVVRQPLDEANTK